MSDARTRIAALLLAAASAVFIWWGWKQGAYFGSVFYPGAAIVFIAVCLMALLAPFDGRIGGAAAVALLALAALSALTLLSAVWSPAPAMALKYGWHELLYLAVFAAGLWAANLLGRNMRAALAPVALAGVVVGIATVVVLATGTDAEWYLHGDATLRFPIGYRNANSAFFLIALWSLLALTVGEWPWQVRAALIAAGTMLVELAILCQSRGTLPAIALAALVYLVVSRNRMRAAIAMALVAIPAIPALPVLLDVFRHGEANAEVIPLLRDSAQAIAASSVLSLVVAAIGYGVVEPRLRVGERTSALIARGAAVVAIIAVLVGGGAFISRHGGPVEFIDQRVDEFTKVGYPDLRSQGVRYGANIGSNRHDFWRVAYDQGLDQPLLGGGAGSFEVAYLEKRLSGESPEDPHSVEALMFGELGAPGLLLFLAFAVAATFAALRSRKLGPAAAGLAAGALAAGTQWFAQTSYDWLWHYPGVTAPAIFLLGAAAAPALLDFAAGPARRSRLAGIAVLVVLALASIPLFLSARNLQQAYPKIANDPGGAVVDLGQAADLNPLDADPLLIKATIESRLGNSAEAIADLREAAEREPRSYEANYLLARELAPTDAAAALVAARRAQELNPRDRHIDALRRRLEAATAGGGG